MLRGESGAGKSTLLNIIGGLEAPTSGEIIVDSKDVRQLSREERTNFYRHEIGIIFQGSYLQPQFTLLENITLPGVFAGMPEAERKQRAEQLAEMLGITENLNFLPKEVSGGQAERACIARALLLSPKIILADEPTSNLDEANAKTVLEILNYIRQQMGIGIRNTDRRGSKRSDKNNGITKSSSSIGHANTKSNSPTICASAKCCN